MNGNGSIFEIDTAGTFTVLHNFAYTEGLGTYSKLIRDSDGNLYGTSGSDSISGRGMVYKLDVNNTLTVLRHFTGSTTDGANPYGGLILDTAGNLYGTTVWGGAFDLGTVFKLDTSGAFTLLHSFSGNDGANPTAELVMDGQGNLYGTTDGSQFGPNQKVFKVDANGTFFVLQALSGELERVAPNGLIRDAAGNLYGTTKDGGGAGIGTVFRLDTNGTLTELHSFGGGAADGATPYGTPVMDSNGNLYGTTAQGGASGYGTIFKLIPGRSGS
jgi:uncharacterized repeat protein (TIGR03803 family)